MAEPVPLDPATARRLRCRCGAVPVRRDAHAGLPGVHRGLRRRDPVLHLLLPWESVRLVADALGAYGLFWMVGLLASMRVHPHVISDAGLRIRHGATVDITIPWDAVAAIRTRNRSLPKSRAVQFEQTESGLAAHIVILSQTNVDITLRCPTAVRLPKGSGEPITELRCYADDPGALVARARTYLPADLQDSKK